MLLYTVQPKWVFEEVRLKGVFWSRPQLDPSTFVGDPVCWPSKFAYDWLSAQMDRRIGARPEAGIYPIWGWYHCYGSAKQKPDLRSRLFKQWAPSERHVLFTLEVPEQEALLSNYDLWHMPLNYSFLGTEPETDDFLARAKAMGLSPYREPPLRDKELHEQLVASWEQIFDLDRCIELLGSEPEDCPVQATFWELRRDQVLEAKEFGAGAPPKKLKL